MSEHPKVSVIIPLYNRAKFIAETVKSVLDQTYPNIEIIVVDDGSTDNFREVLERFEGKIRLLEHPGGLNQGQSAAINLGIRESESKYVSILDSDDLFASEKIELQVKFLEKNSALGVVYSNGQAVDGDGHFLYYMYEQNHTSPDGPETVLLYSHYNVPSNALVKRCIFDKVGGFDESMRSAQDHDMAVRLAEVSKIGYLADVLWVYRRHAASQSGMHAARRWKTGFKILEKASTRYPYSKKVLRKRKAVLHFRMGLCFWDSKKYFVAFIHLFRSGLLDPVRGIKVCFGLDRL